MPNSIGKLRYSPKAESIPNPSKWWLVVDADPNLARLYRELFNWENRCRFKIFKPAWDAHISVVRDEKPPRIEMWEKYSGEEVVFEYDPTIKTNGEYYWLDVQCERLLDIREEMGLPRLYQFDNGETMNLHLTIGRIM
jgi:hypothetical protein